VRVIFDRDPAAKSVWEVIFCYQGLHAIWLYRLSHYLFLRGWVLLPRMISNLGRFLTGIEIHPGAKIGEGLFIDHGTGVVIGETAEIGRNVTLYQGVTLGGTGKESGKRHPTVGNNVVVASGAKVLGSFKVGDHAKIGAGSVVLKEVPPYSTVVGIPGRVVLMNGEKIRSEEELRAKIKAAALNDEELEEAEEKDVDLDHTSLPDPEQEAINELRANVEALMKRVRVLERELEEKNAKGL
jgi:serine O-acetyltransferase